MMFIKKLFLFLIVWCFSVDSFAQELPQKKDSLLEATIYTGVPTLGIITSIFVYEIEINNRTSYNKLWNNFENGFQYPVWDSNPWYVNYVGHPITGAEAYLLARNRNCNIFGSFLYSTAISITWEYGLESWIGARPSTQDLLLTSTLGSVLGEARFLLKNKLIHNTDLLSRIIVVILDPIDAVYKTLEM